MAVASSSALRKEDKTSGTNNETADFALRIKGPVLKLAPLAICASLILSISSRNVGTNLRAMDIIIAISCDGILRALRGRRSLSIPLTNSVGDVVMVRIEALNMRRINCHVVIATLNSLHKSLSRARRNGGIGVPSVKRRCSKKRNTKKNNIGLRALAIWRGVNREIGIRATRKALMVAAVNISPFRINMLNTTANPILTLGSNRWMIDSPGYIGLFIHDTGYSILDA